MLQNKDLDRTLKIWGPIKSSISRESMELWGRVEPESVINLYNMLSKGLVTTETMALKRKNKNRTKEKLAASFIQDMYEQDLNAVKTCRHVRNAS